VSIFRPIAIGVLVSSGASYALHDLDGLPWDLLSITNFDISGVTIYWSWVIFSLAAIIAWALQKALEV
jgi:hypothetical protein